MDRTGRARATGRAGSASRKVTLGIQDYGNLAALALGDSLGLWRVCLFAFYFIFLSEAVRPCVPGKPNMLTHGRTILEEEVGRLGVFL